MIHVLFVVVALLFIYIFFSPQNTKTRPRKGTPLCCWTWPKPSTLPKVLHGPLHNVRIQGFVVTSRPSPSFLRRLTLRRQCWSFDGRNFQFIDLRIGTNISILKSWQSSLTSNQLWWFQRWKIAEICACSGTCFFHFIWPLETHQWLVTWGDTEMISACRGQPTDEVLYSGWGGLSSTWCMRQPWIFEFHGKLS